MVESIDCSHAEGRLTKSASQWTTEEYSSHSKAPIAIYGHVNVMTGTIRRAFSPNNANAHVFWKNDRRVRRFPKRRGLCLGQ